MFNHQSKKSKDFLTSLSNCFKYFNVIFCIFNFCILIHLIGNIKCYHKTVLTVFFIKTKINKQTKQNKTVVKFTKVFNLPVGR